MSAAPLSGIDCHTLIGRVAVEYIKEHAQKRLRLGEIETAFYCIDLLEPADLTGIANAIHTDPDLKDTTGIYLPRNRMASEANKLPPEYLTDLNSLEVRNGSYPDKSVIIMVNTGDDKESSLEDVYDIGDRLLIPLTHLWVKIIREHAANFDDTICDVLENSLTGLQQAESQRITAFANYALAVARQIENGQTIVDSLGEQLPLVEMPKYRGAFNMLGPKIQKGQIPPPSAWRKVFETTRKKVKCFYLKQHSTGAMLTDEQLEEVLKKVATASTEAGTPLDPKVIQAFEAFIEGSGCWDDSATQHLAHDFDYEEDRIKDIFHDLKAVRSNLGQETLDFFNHNRGSGEKDAYLLSKEEETYLEGLAKGSTTQGEADAEAIKFFENRRSIMSTDENLRSKWEKYVFPSEIECTDFVAGIGRVLATQLCLTQENTGKRTITVKCAHESNRSLNTISLETRQFFTTRYQGFIKATEKLIDWDCDKLLDLSSIKKKGSDAGGKKPKSAKRIRFTVHVEASASSRKESMRLNWRFDDNSVACCLHDDLKRLAEAPFTPCSTALSPSVTTGTSKPLNLLNVGTLNPAFGQVRGSFVPRSQNHTPLDKEVESALASPHFPPAGKDTIVPAWQTFANKYREVMKEIFAKGFETADLLGLGEAYGDLIFKINKFARGDSIRNQLLRPILAIGNVNIQATKMLAIVTPWHPLRLASIKLKTEIVKNLAIRLADAKDTRCADKGLLASDIDETIKNSWLPEITVHWNGEKPSLLCQSMQTLDYSTYECPKASVDKDAESNDDPQAGAAVLKSVVERYLKLYPHERDSLSAVLYNCDSALLPDAVVKSLSKLEDDDDDPIRCQVILYHRKPNSLRSVYEKIIDDPATDPDTLVISEVTEDFMARLRIEVHVGQATTSPVKGIPPHDIVFLQDVVARTCEVVFESNNVTTLAWEQFNPARFGVRRPLANQDTKTVTYLVSPGQTKAGWDYITAIHTLCEQQDWDQNETKRYVPQRKLTFSTPESSKIFEEIHKLGNWVVNYDSVLDRRMLLNRGIKVIRFKQASSTGRNIIISSQASFALLETMVEARLRELDLQLGAGELKALAKKMIEKANTISGDLALRAARRSVNAGELIGVVLSAFLSETLLGSKQQKGWFFIDDYAEWLGQKEGALADLLAMRITPLPSGKPRIDILVTEAKYVSETNIEKHELKSKEQVLQTVEKLHNALVKAPEAVDRPAWLARLGEMIVGGLEFSNEHCTPEDVERWRDQLVTGNATFNIVGVSQIFTSTPNVQSYHSLDLREDPRCFQEKFGFKTVRDIVLAYFHDTDYEPDRLPELNKTLSNNNEEAEGDTDSGGPESPKPTPSSTPPVSGEQEPKPTSTVPLEDSNKTPHVAIDVDPSRPWRDASVAEFIDQKGQIAGHSDEDKAWLEEITTTCQRALQRLGMDAVPAGIPPKLTPNAALLRFKGSENLSTPKVKAKADELLTRFGLDIMAVQSEPLRVCISVARPKRAILKLCDVWKSIKTSDVKPGGFEIPIAVREDTGEILTLKPTTEDMPHTLIAGESNSGKSVLIRNILLGIACTATPDEAKLTVIDAKLGVDFLAFEGLPHLTEPVITEQEVAITRLKSLITEMERRYTVLAKNGVENIVELHNLPNPTEQMPVLWVIHDEFADWMQTDSYRETVPPLVSRLGIKARGAGIYLVFAAQRPDNQVMPMQLRDNLGNKLCLKVNSPGGADLVLGLKNSGAERLLGKGHMLAKLPRASDPIYCQVPFVDRDDVAEMVKRLKK